MQKQTTNPKEIKYAAERAAIAEKQGFSQPATHYHGSPCTTCGGTLRFVKRNYCVKCKSAQDKHYRCFGTQVGSKALL